MKKIISAIMGILLILTTVFGVVYVFKNPILIKDFTEDKISVFEAIEVNIKAKVLVPFSGDEPIEWYLNNEKIGEGEKQTFSLTEGSHIIKIKKGNLVKTINKEVYKTFDFENKEEKAISLLMPFTEEDKAIHIENQDSDNDGLLDTEENELWHTNPFNKDTDNDGINDREEILLNRDPLKREKKSSNKYIINNIENTTLLIEGKGGIVNTFVDVIDVPEWENFVVGKPIDINSNELFGKEIKTAELTFSFNDFDLSKEEINELAIFYYNEDTKLFEELKTKINTTDNTAKANLKHFSIYFLGRKDKININGKTEISFVVDFSASMYSAEYLIKQGIDESNTLEDINNDPEFKRIDLIETLVNKLPKNNFLYSFTYYTSDVFTMTNINDFISSPTNSAPQSTPSTHLIPKIRNDGNTPSALLTPITEEELQNKIDTAEYWKSQTNNNTKNKNEDLNKPDKKNTFLDPLENIDSVIQNFKNIKSKKDINFNGTQTLKAMGEAIDNTFSLNKENKKFIILLTDGYDSNGLFNFSFETKESIVKEANAKNITIITIGLGKCDTNTLKYLAENTKGIYLYANNSNTLEKLLDILMASLNKLDASINVKNQNNKKENKEVNLMADSGFNPAIDGFWFENFSSKQHDFGNCYGISSMSKLKYENIMFSEFQGRTVHGIMGAIKNIDGFMTFLNSLVNKDAQEYQGGSLKLESFKISDEIFNEIKTKNTIDLAPEPIAGLNYHPEKVLTTKNKVKKLVYKEADKIAFSKAGLEIKTKINNNNIEEEYTELFDVWADNITVSNSTMDVIKSIDWYMTQQGDSIIEGELLTLLGVGKITEFKDLTNAIHKSLSIGKPQMIGMTSSLGRHAVLIVDMYSDKNNKNKIYLGLYDSNSPKEKRYAIVERISAPVKTKFGDISIKDKYKFEYNYSDKLKFTELELTNLLIEINKNEIYQG